MFPKKNTHELYAKKQKQIVSLMLAFSLLLFSLTPNTRGQSDRQLSREPSGQTKKGDSSKRTALVIGNSTYATSPLANPANDATDVAAALKSLGFDVLSGTNLTKEQMIRLVREFGEKLQGGGVGLFYYAGHGVQVEGSNFLIPIGATIKSEGDVELEGVDVNRVLRAMDDAGNSINIVILDACRNNPFARSWRSAEQGLAGITKAPAGTLIAFATAPGSVASDGAGRNGLYTSVLLEAMRTPGLNLTEVFERVSERVQDSTNRKQVPWISSSVTGKFYFRTPANIDTNTTGAVDSSSVEKEFWDSIKESNDPKDFDLYLKEYPNGVYKIIAQNKLRKLTESSSTQSGNTNNSPTINDDASANRALEELSAWNKTKTSTNPIDFQEFLKQYPNGTFASQARAKISSLGDAEWNRVKASKDPAVYDAYIKANPNGQYTSLARERKSMIVSSMIAWEQISESKNIEDFKAYVAKYPEGAFVEEAKAMYEPPKVGTMRKNSLGMEFMYIPAGSFQMGATSGESVGAVHQVTISKPFFMGRYEVTQEQWQAVMGNNPSSFKDCPKCPVESVSWDDVQQFIAKLNSQVNDGFKYRLPTEAEWEYAARAGATGDYAGSLDSMAWYYDNSGDSHLSGERNYDKQIANNNKTHPVGTKQPNGWGLYDTQGNVWEWCQDWYGDYSSGNVTDPGGATSGSLRVIRGGSFGETAADLRTAYRLANSPSYRYYIIGFRLLRTSL